MDGGRRREDLSAEQVSLVLQPSREGKEPDRARAKPPLSNILAGLAGITSDANSLVNFARNAAQKHLFTYDEDIPVEMLVQRLCDMKQGYTQYGGERCSMFLLAIVVPFHSSPPCLPARRYYRYGRYNILNPPPPRLALGLLQRTPPLTQQVSDHSVSPSSTSATIRSTASNYTTPTRLETTRDGRRPASAPTTLPPRAC